MKKEKKFFKPKGALVPIMHKKKASKVLKYRKLKKQNELDDESFREYKIK